MAACVSHPNTSGLPSPSSCSPSTQHTHLCSTRALRCSLWLLGNSMREMTKVFNIFSSHSFVWCLTSLFYHKCRILKDTCSCIERRTTLLREQESAVHTVNGARRTPCMERMRSKCRNKFCISIYWQQWPGWRNLPKRLGVCCLCEHHKYPKIASFLEHINRIRWYNSNTFIVRHLYWDVMRCKCSEECR